MLEPTDFTQHQKEFVDLTTGCDTVHRPDSKEKMLFSIDK
jgi:hypothetical protein